MSRAELMKLSPRFYRRLIKEHWDSRKRGNRMLEVMVGQLIAMVANTGFKGWEEARKPQEFMPSEWGAKAAGRQPRMTNKQRLMARQVLRDYLRRAAAVKV